MTYYDNSATYISNAFNRESRFRSIAMNAVREGVMAFGRHDFPFTDNDAAIMENIFQQLRSLGEEINVNRQQEHQSLSFAKDAPAPAQAQIAAVLGDVPSTLRAEVEPVVKAKVPTAKV